MRNFLQQTEMGEKNLSKLNLKLLPIKLHYFFFYAALGGVVPYLPVVAKGLGINATAVGIAYMLPPFFVILCRPFFGFVTDRLRDIKVTVLSLVVVTAVAYVTVLSIPPLENDWTSVDRVDCRGPWMVLTLNDSSVEACSLDELPQDLKFKQCNSSYTEELNGKTTPLNITITNVLKFEPVTNFTCGCISHNSTFLTCNQTSVFKSFQFWMFALMILIGGTANATVTSLSDSACYEILTDQPHFYGRQRLWGTISWGLVTLLTGFVNDLAKSDTETYAPGFYLMIAFGSVDLVLLMTMRLNKANFSLNICKDIRKIFSCSETVMFAVAVYIVGAFSGLIWNYLFWFLQDLGATQTLMGLAVAIQCLGSELPFFFFASWFIRKFGHFYCLAMSFAAFAVRFAIYYFVRDPWMMLPAELLHGLTYAVFYASMTGFASQNAPPGTEATMMGIMGGLYEGLGLATGSLLGGVGFEKLGGRNTFLVSSLICLLCVPSFAVVHNIIKDKTTKN